MRAPHFLVLSLSFAIVPLTLGTGCSSSAPANDSAAAESEDALSAGANAGYFIVTRRDTRKCAAPKCGGLFVKRVNQDLTRCADGSLQADCYVESIQLDGIGLSTREEDAFRGSLEDGKALIKARTYKTRINHATYGTLKANEGWLGATGATPDGTFYRAADNGVRCVKAPCPSIGATALNGAGNDYNVIAVGFSGTSADASAVDRAQQAIGTSEGVLVAGGVALPKCLPTATDCGPNLVPTEFYLRITKREGLSCGGRGQSFCNDGQYCNWLPKDICGAADAAGTCAYRPEICMALYSPVCGCDDKTYGNSCNAAAAGVSVASQGACAPAAPSCGGIAGTTCPGAGQCVDDPNDSCDPQNGGADCGGLCQCGPNNKLCTVGHHWDGTASVCACVAD